MDPLVKAYLDRLEEIRIQHINHLIGGAVVDHGEYRNICGILQGVAIATREMKDLISQTDQDD